MDRKHIRSSFCFGLSSGIITTLGLMVGLYSSTFSRGVVLAGIFTIAVADSCSDSVSMHFSEESEGVHTMKDLWLVTFFAFFSKFLVTLSFVPVFFILSIDSSIIVNVFQGLVFLSVLSYFMAKQGKKSAFKAILEHVLILIFVVFVTFYLGRLIDRVFLQ